MISSIAICLSLFLLLQLWRETLSYSLDRNQLQIGVWLSGAAYCEKDAYKIMKISGPASGFIYKDTLYDIKTDIQGYIGVLSAEKFIYVVLRGSSSKMNWLADFEISLVPYTSYPECDCSVHNGFYKTALNIKNKTVETVKLLNKIYPQYSVLVTGHSYGAAISQLLAMEIEKEGVKTVVYNYGQPRVGNAKYAAYVNTVLREYWRATHYQDIVPHVPPIDFGYLHSCREVFEDAAGKLNECSETNCEDQKCADQYSLIQTNSADHLIYLGHRVSCNESIV